MIKITITKDADTKNESKIDVLIHKEQTLDKLIDVLYPSKNRVDAKGYISLVNFIYGGR